MHSKTWIGMNITATVHNIQTPCSKHGSITTTGMAEGLNVLMISVQVRIILSKGLHASLRVNKALKVQVQWLDGSRALSNG